MRVVFERKSTTATGTINVMSPALRGAIFENIIIGPTLRDLHTWIWLIEVVKLHTSWIIAKKNFLLYQKL